MGDIRITIPDELHRKLKVKAAQQGKPLKEIVIEGLEKVARECNQA